MFKKPYEKKRCFVKWNSILLQLNNFFHFTYSWVRQNFWSQNVDENSVGGKKRTLLFAPVIRIQILRNSMVNDWFQASNWIAVILAWLVRKERKVHSCTLLIIEAWKINHYNLTLNIIINLPCLRNRTLIIFRFHYYYYYYYCVIFDKYTIYLFRVGFLFNM